jgi:predicted membrane chloride channel (bestrophin family)
LIRIKNKPRRIRYRASGIRNLRHDRGSPIMSLFVRLLLTLAAPITALFVARDSQHFDIIQTLMATVIATVVVAVFAFWPYIRKPKA